MLKKLGYFLFILFIFSNIHQSKAWYYDYDKANIDKILGSSIDNLFDCRLNGKCGDTTLEKKYSKPTYSARKYAKIIDSEIIVQNHNDILVKEDAIKSRYIDEIDKKIKNGNNNRTVSNTERVRYAKKDKENKINNFNKLLEIYDKEEDKNIIAAIEEEKKFIQSFYEEVIKTFIEIRKLEITAFIIGDLSDIKKESTSMRGLTMLDSCRTGSENFRQLINEIKTDSSLSTEMIKALDTQYGVEVALYNSCKENIIAVPAASIYERNGMLKGMCFFLDILLGDYGRIIACFFVIFIGFLMLFGHIRFHTLVGLSVALAFFYGAVSIANIISNNKYSCKQLYIVPQGDKDEDSSTDYEKIFCHVKDNMILEGKEKEKDQYIIEINAGDYKYGDKIDGECKKNENSGGKNYEGAAYATCGADGSWKVTNKCKEVGKKCDKNISLNIINGRRFELILGENAENGKTISISIEKVCELGYEGPIFAKCEGGTWKVHGSCTLIVCRNDTVFIKHGKIVIGTSDKTTDYGKGLTVSCDAGYEPTKQEMKAICKSDHTWDIQGECKPIECPTTIENEGTYNATFGTIKNNKFNQNPTYGKCNKGYEGTIKATCQTDKTWKIDGECKPVECNDPVNTIDLNASFDTNDMLTYNEYDMESIKGTCYEGYEGEVTAKCGSNKAWITNGKCEPVKCSNSIDTTSYNGSFKQEDIDSHIKYNNGIITGECNEGYTGEITAECGNDKTWKISSTCTNN